MKKRIAITLLVVVAAWVTWEQVKGKIFTWYAVNMMERSTEHVSSRTPDQIVLTWSDEPSTTQTISWRTSPEVATGVVQYQREEDAAPAKEATAARTLLEESRLGNDPVNARYTAVLTALSPATRYKYRVGDGSENGWSGWRHFTTAPAGPKDFSIVYLGDPQVGLEHYGNLLHRAHEKAPDAAFHVITGDLVNSGAMRNEWDDFFHFSAGVFDYKPIVPCLGNHDYQKQTVPRNYLEVFALPENGPRDFPREHAYSFTYGDALFVVLDSNLPAEQDQTVWLEEQLAASKHTWKIAIYHHPAYNSAPNRDSKVAFDKWTPLFDKYHVDVALQGHDHAYMRTYPMRGGKRVDSAAEGTFYVVAVSGTKYYEQVQRDYAEKAYEELSTYQIIDISADPPRLSYRAFDFDHNLRDSFVIEK